MANHPDYYAVLGVNKSAPAGEIRKAYKKLARKYHPDANADDATALERFKDIQTAWAVLGDESKRANFDKYGSPEAPAFASDGQRQGQGRWAGSADDSGVPFDLEDILGGLGGGYHRGGFHAEQAEWPVRGPDIRTEVQIPFLLAAEGGTYELRFQRDGGSAAETVAIAIPAGIDSGSLIRLSGQGMPGINGGGPGDLLIAVNIAAHAWFRRDGANVLLDIPVSLSESALGTKVDIPTALDGTLTLTIPPATSSGAKLRLRGKGIRDRVTGNRGDMLATIKIVPPQQIDQRTRKLLEELQTCETDDCRAGLWH